MTPEQHEQIVALGRNPVSDASPVGEPVRYDEIFEQLQAQMDRIASLSGEEVNWRAVVDLSTEILKNKSKDLLVMTYLTLGLFETEGYAGLVAGFDAYRELLAKYWEGCFPKIKPPQGRYNALQYLSDKILVQVELKGGQAKRMPAANEKEAVHKCADACAALDQAVSTAFQSQPESPNMIPLTRAFKALKEKVGPLVTAPPPAAAAPAGAPTDEGAAAPSAPAAGAAGSGGGVAIPDQFKNATQAVQAIKAIAKYFLGQDNKDPTGYRLMRTAMFGPISEPPKDKIIPGPPAQRRQFFENLASSGNWPQLLTEAEGQFATTPLWLDLQRFSALALKGLGPAYKAAHDAVVLEVVALFGRMPALFDVSFKEGAAFADGATKAWLDEAAASSGGGGGGGGRAGGAAGDPVDAAVGGAKKLLAESKPLEAIALLSAQAAASGAGRDRFRAQLALGSLCLDMNKLPLAQSILEGLESQIDQYRLEEWEPSLSARVLYDLHECLTKSKPKPTPEDLTRLAKVFSRLARLDPGAALKLEAAKKTA